MCLELTGEESRPSKSKIFKECFKEMENHRLVVSDIYMFCFHPYFLGGNDPQFFTRLFFQMGLKMLKVKHQLCSKS